VIIVVYYVLTVVTLFIATFYADNHIHGIVGKYFLWYISKVLYSFV
jgi:hypothetical protein